MVIGQACDDRMTDDQLLEYFVTRRDEAAFEALVRKHGPMVLGVCRRVLRHAQDAEDAFQAAFLVLVRRAASIGQRELLGNWLYGVAYRTALDARAMATRRRRREKQVSRLPEPETGDVADDWRELRPLLDQELSRLPDKYRTAVVLCDLEGGTRREVARRLGIPEGTLSGRLTTAHRMLARRLARLGLAPTGGALTAALSPGAALAGVPQPLVTATAQAATTGGVSAPVATLAEGVMKTMWVKKLTMVTVAFVAAAGLIGVTAALVRADREPNGARVLELDDRGRYVAWSPDGKTLAVVTKVEKAFLGIQYDRKGSAIRLWDVETGQVRKTLAESTEKGLAFQQVVFSADGKMIAATVSQRDMVNRPNGIEIRIQDVVKIWDAKTLALKQTVGGDSQLVCVALSADGKWVAAGDPGKKMVKVWKTATGAPEKTLETGETQPWLLAFAPDNSALVVGGQKGDHSGEVQLWDARTWTLKHAIKQEKYVNSVAFSADGKRIACGSGGNLVELWDARTGKRIHSLRGVRPGTRCVAFSPDGQKIAAGWGYSQVRLWDVQTGELKATLTGHADQIYSLAFAPDSRSLASVSQDQTLRLWPINKPPAGPR